MILGPPGQFLVGYLQGQLAVGYAEADPVAGAHVGEGAADGGFRIDVEHDGAEGRAAHAAIRDPDHVLDAGPGQLARNGQVAGFGHAWRALGTDVLQDEDVLRGHVEVVGVDALRQVFGVLEDHGPALVLHQPGVRRGLLDDGPARGQVAPQHRDGALGVDGIAECPDHVLLEAWTGPFDLFPEGPAGDREGFQAQQRPEFAQQRDHPSGLVEILHVVLARWLQIQQDRSFPPHLVQGLQIEVDAQAAGDGRQVDDPVGGTADGQEDPHGVLEGGRGEDPVHGQPVPGHLDRLGSGLFSDAGAVRRDRRRRGAPRHGHAERLGQAGHGAGRSHHRAGADAGHQLVVHRFCLLGVDFAGAELAPVAAAVGAGAHPHAAVGAGQHGAGDELDGRNAGRSRAHQLRRHGLVAAADEHHRIHGLGADHLFGIHGHEVAQVHAGGRGETFVEGDGGEGHGQPACEQDAALDRFDEHGHVAVARIVGAARVGDADHHPIQGRVRVARPLDERLAQELGKPFIAIAGQALVQACGLGFAGNAGHGAASIGWDA